MKMYRLIRKQLVIGCTAMFVCALSGCGTTRHRLNIDSTYEVKPGTRVEVGEVTNDTGQTFDIDIGAVFAEELSGYLEREDVLWKGDDAPRLTIISYIVDYEKGDAFKRWLMPGWGSTALVVRCELVDGEEVIGSAEALRTVSMGGAYSIGAWRAVFDKVAEDIVSDLREQLRK